MALNICLLCCDSVLVVLWFLARKTETVAHELRILLSLKRLFLNAGCVVKNTRMVAYTTAAGVGFGA